MKLCDELADSNAPEPIFHPDSKMKM